MRASIEVPETAAAGFARLAAQRIEIGTQLVDRQGSAVAVMANVNGMLTVRRTDGAEGKVHQLDLADVGLRVASAAPTARIEPGTQVWRQHAGSIVRGVVEAIRPDGRAMVRLSNGEQRNHAPAHLLSDWNVEPPAAQSQAQQIGAAMQRLMEHAR